MSKINISYEEGWTLLLVLWLFVAFSSEYSCWNLEEGTFHSKDSICVQKSLLFEPDTHGFYYSRPDEAVPNLSIASYSNQDDITNITIPYYFNLNGYYFDLELKLKTEDYSQIISANIFSRKDKEKRIPIEAVLFTKKTPWKIKYLYGEYFGGLIEREGSTYFPEDKFSGAAEAAITKDPKSISIYHTFTKLHETGNTVHNTFARYSFHHPYPVATIPYRNINDENIITYVEFNYRMKMVNEENSDDISFILSEKYLGHKKIIFKSIR